MELPSEMWGEIRLHCTPMTRVMLGATCTTERAFFEPWFRGVKERLRNCPRVVPSRLDLFVAWCTLEDDSTHLLEWMYGKSFSLPSPTKEFIVYCSCHHPYDVSSPLAPPHHRRMVQRFVCAGDYDATCRAAYRLNRIHIWQWLFRCGIRSLLSIAEVMYGAGACGASIPMLDAILESYRRNGLMEDAATWQTMLVHAVDAAHSSRNRRMDVVKWLTGISPRDELGPLLRIFREDESKLMFGGVKRLRFCWWAHGQQPRIWYDFEFSLYHGLRGWGLGNHGPYGYRQRVQYSMVDWFMRKGMVFPPAFLARFEQEAQSLAKKRARKQRQREAWREWHQQINK